MYCIFFKHIKFSALSFDLWMGLQIADGRDLKSFMSRSHVYSGFLFRGHFSLCYTQESRKMLLPNAAIILLSLLSLRGATRKFAVLVNRYSKAFTVISMDSTGRDLYNSLLFRTGDVRKSNCHNSVIILQLNSRRANK